MLLDHLQVIFYRNHLFFSAIKIKGTSSYTLARKGKKWNCHQANHNLWFSNVVLIIQNLICNFQSHVVRHFYIRSIAHDLGKNWIQVDFFPPYPIDAIGPYKLEDALSITNFNLHYNNWLPFIPKIRHLIINIFSFEFWLYSLKNNIFVAPSKYYQDFLFF